jgi:hypothetical protein
MQLTRFTYDGDDYRARYFIDGKRVSFDAYNMIFCSTRYRPRMHDGEWYDAALSILKEES